MAGLSKALASDVDALAKEIQTTEKRVSALLAQMSKTKEAAKAADAKAAEMLRSRAELLMVRVQAQMSDYARATALASDINKKSQDQAAKIISNIR